MTPVLVLLVIAIVSTLIIRVGSLALAATGLSADASAFQALSAFFGVGFTTRESELVVNHPVRRRVIRDLIICGNIGLTSVLGTVVATAVHVDLSATSWWLKAAALVGGLLLLWVAARLTFIRRAVDWTIRRSLASAGVVRAMDYELLLRVGAGYSIAEVEILRDHPLVGRTLGEVRLRSRGIVVLGIARDVGDYEAVPNGDSEVRVGDVLTVYGSDALVRALGDGSLFAEGAPAADSQRAADPTVRSPT